MQKAIEACEKQLSDMQNLTTSLLSTHTLNDWMALVRNAHLGHLSHLEEDTWKARFEYFLQANPSGPSPRGESGFLIRLMEWYQTRIQHSLYINHYGQVYHSEHASMTRLYESMTIPISGLISAIKGSRLPLILPFHTVSPLKSPREFCCTKLQQFTLPLRARTIRLIAHRNALHTSFTTFTHLGKNLSVHPPPPPPSHGRINVGYVSSDFTWVFLLLLAF